MRHRLANLSRVSTTVLALALATPALAQTAQDPSAAGSAASAQGDPATVQEQQDTAEDEVVVTGVRASLQGAQDIKRNATSVVDSIVAEDIGKLPDNTVSDALQRVTGVQVTRAAGEAATVLIRGLPDVSSFINGREVFTGTGRGVALQDIPAELVAGIDVYKTATPELIEGSVTGRIDIRLRRPLDFQDGQIAGSVRGIYGEQSGKWSYVGSALISNRWTFGDGQELGLLIGASYNRRRYEDQTGFNFGFQPFTNAATGNVPVLIPDTVGGLVSAGDRKRPAVNFSLQYKPTPDIEIYADGLFTGYRNEFDTDFFVGLPKAGDVVAVTTQPGSATSETLNRPVAGTIRTNNNFTITSKQAFTEKTDGYQFNTGARVTAGRALLSTEFTYNKSTVNSQALILDTSFFVPRIDYNFNVDGTPQVNFNGFAIQNAANFNLFTLFDNRTASESRQYAWRGDLALDVGEGFLKTIKVGARYANREGSAGGTNTSGLGLGAFPGLPGSGFTGLAGNAPTDILGGKLGVDGFGVASRAFILNNIGQLRGLAGVPASGRVFDPNATFSLTENVYAFYGQLNFGTERLEGVLGARVVNTDTRLSATQITNVPVGPAVITPINGKSNLLDVLPSLSLKYNVTDEVVLRLIAGRSLTRPQFGQLNPATTLTQLGVTGGAFGTGAGGNPALSPVKSDNLDATLEWYFSRAGSFTLSGFYRKLDGYIQTNIEPELLRASNGTLQTFQVSRPRNFDGQLKGVEVAYQHFFDFLPGALSGFGVQANFTYSDGEVDFPIAAGVQRRDIALVSKYSYNIVGIYEKYGFSARLAYNWRSRYTEAYGSDFPGGLFGVSPIAFLDFSASYDVTPNITLTVDATNLLDRQYQDSFGTSGFTPRDTRQFDRTFGGGVRVRF